jgi:hypothetical protein
MFTSLIKWMALGLTSSAAMVSFLSDSDAIGLFGWFASEGLSLSDYVVRDVRLAPAADTTYAIGDSVHLAATVTDKRGSAIFGATVVWSSLDPTVASVDSSGHIVTRGPGRVGIVAQVREYADTAWLTSSQRLAGIKIDIDSSFAVPEQEQRTLFAMAVDARRHEILGEPVTWTSSDQSVLHIDSLGTATGKVPGRVTVTASARAFQASAEIRVVPAAGGIALVGQTQRGPAGMALREPIAVRVWTRGGTPLENALVRFYPLYEHGTVEETEVRSDEQGVATTRWVLGPDPGHQSLRVSVEGADTTLLIGAEADPHPENFSVTHGHDSLSGRFGTRLAEVIVIEATDSLGRIRPDIPVVWTARNGGSVEPLDVRTDSLGQARARWILGAKAGRQYLEAVVGNPRTIPPLVISAMAEPGQVSRAEIVSGNKQRGMVGKSLSKAVVARALDEHGNAVPGATLTVTTEDGSVPERDYVTDAAGKVAVAWTLGRGAGNQQLSIRIEGVKAPLTASATAMPRGAANIEFVNPPASGTAGQPLARRVVARVTDAYGNPVSDRQVFFSGPAGIVNPQRAMSDGEGLVTTTWTLGSRRGPSWLQASVEGTKLKTIMRIEVK